MSLSDPFCVCYVSCMKSSLSLYVPSSDYASTYCSDQIRGTTLLFKMASNMATETSKITLIQYLKQVDIDLTKLKALLFNHISRGAFEKYQWVISLQI